MLEVDPKRRITPAALLATPWVKNETAPKDHLVAAVESIKMVTRNWRLRKAVRAVIAMQRLARGFQPSEPSQRAHGSMLRSVSMRLSTALHGTRFSEQSAATVEDPLAWVTQAADASHLERTPPRATAAG